MYVNRLYVQSCSNSLNKHLKKKHRALSFIQRPQGIRSEQDAVAAEVSTRCREQIPKSYANHHLQSNPARQSASLMEKIWDK